MDKNTLLYNAFTLRRELLQKILDETRDMDTECGYPSAIKVSDYQAAFNRNGIGTRIVKLMPEECWSVTPEVVENEESTKSEFEKIWKELCKKFQIFNCLFNLDVLSGIGRYGVLLIGIDDGKKLIEAVDGIDLKTGEMTSQSKHNLMYLRSFSESSLDVKAKETDVSSPRYGKPTIYRLKLENIEGVAGATELGMHWTRVIHVAEDLYESVIFGTPRMKIVYNYLLDVKKMLGGSAEMFWKGGFPGLTFEINPERTTALTDVEKKEIKEEFEDYSNHLQRYLALTGVKAKSLQTQVASPKEHFEVQLKAIGIALGVPYRLLLGSEEAKLASTQDAKTWSRRVTKRQVSYCTPVIIRSFVDRLIAFGILPLKEYEVTWPSLDELDPKDKALITKDKTEAITKYVTAGAEVLIPPHQFLTHVMGFTDEQADVFLKEAETWNDDGEPKEDK